LWLRGPLLRLGGPLLRLGLLLALGSTFQNLLEDLAENVHRENAPRRKKTAKIKPVKKHQFRL
jgi:hypothetical protein